MYGGPHVDPTHGRAKWHQKDFTWKQKELPPLGATNEREYDEQHGRWWFNRKETQWRPKLYTTIGRHARSKRLKRTIVRWAGQSPNFKALKRDLYRKRWPKTEQLGARFFAEFCLKGYDKRTLAETAHTLPLYGVGCKFWRAKTADCAETKGQYFVADSAEYRLRPIRGLLGGRSTTSAGLSAWAWRPWPRASGPGGTSRRREPTPPCTGLPSPACALPTPRPRATRSDRRN